MARRSILVTALATMLAGMACAETPRPHAAPGPTPPPPTAPFAPRPVPQPPEPVARSHANPARPPVDPDAPVHDAEGRERGIATWYGTRENGRRTASGERLSDSALTAAHKTLPFGTRVKVTNLENGRQVIVRITDRGPYGHGHIIDLSKAAARVLDMIGAGKVPVTLEVLH